MSPTTDPADLVRSYWDRIQARDWTAARALLADDLVVEWPATAERFTSGKAFIDYQVDYPDGWTIQVQRIAAAGAAEGGAGTLVVSEVQVPLDGVGVFAVASFLVVRDGRIVSGREYWVTCGGEDPPPGRSQHVERYDGRLAP